MKRPWYYPSPSLTDLVEETPERLVWRRKASGQLVEGILDGKRFHIREIAG